MDEGAFYALPVCILLSNVVDISNIVMLETGQPMHFYDKDAIKNQEITVVDGIQEDYTALDGVTYALQPEDIVITNDGKPIGIAGIMGGDDSKNLGYDNRFDHRMCDL